MWRSGAVEDRSHAPAALEAPHIVNWVLNRKPGVCTDAQNAFAAQARGLDVLRGQVSMFRAASPDLTMTIDAQYEDGKVVINRWTSTATQTGDLPMLPATGRTATVTGILIDRYKGATRGAPIQPTRGEGHTPRCRQGPAPRTPNAEGS